MKTLIETALKKHCEEVSNGQFLVRDMLPDVLNTIEEVLKQNLKLTIDGLNSDGYTFICPEHGLHPNCDCQDKQIKMFY